MKLEEYARAVLQDGNTDDFPKTLELTQKLVGVLTSLYVTGEKEGREYGCNLTYEPAEGEFIVSMRYQGDSNSCPIRTMAHLENCADAHCHPADSIGDVGGYSPHSMEDFLAFEDQRHKPLFVRFVVSGDHIYAVSYRKGRTIFDAQGIDEVRGELAYQIKQYFNARCPVGEEERIKRVMRVQEEAQKLEKDPNEAAFALVTEFKKKTPGLGNFTREATMKACEKVAAKYKFGFYARSETYKLGRVV